MFGYACESVETSLGLCQNVVSDVEASCVDVDRCILWPQPAERCGHPVLNVELLEQLASLYWRNKDDSTRHDCVGFCKSFLFLLVNLIAVSLHCLNNNDKTSHHFC